MVGASCFFSAIVRGSRRIRKLGRFALFFGYRSMVRAAGLRTEGYRVNRAALANNRVALPDWPKREAVPEPGPVGESTAKYDPLWVKPLREYAESKSPFLS